MRRPIPYGIMNYAELVRKQAYFVDKTAYIHRLESVNNPVFLRPRRFGKSLFCSMLQYYYDLGEAGRFDELFGRTWIGKNPTPDHNAFLILKLDFSVVRVSGNINEIEYSFNRYGNGCLSDLWRAYPEVMREVPEVRPDDDAGTNLAILLGHLQKAGAPQIYVIIDEYDNFANQLITSHQDSLYREITTSDSFFRSFFKVLKQGRQTGAIANIFITGVLPITIDDLASGFNIATFITLDISFESLLGFTESEVHAILDDIYQDYEIEPTSRKQVEEMIKSQYNGYHFVDPDSDAVYNSTMLMFFLRQFCEKPVIPKQLTDLNLRTDLSWVKRITATSENTWELVTSLIETEEIAYDDTYLTTKFSMSQFFEKNFFPVSFYYLGMLTKKDQFWLRLPNLNMRRIFAEYFNELNNIDVSTRYAEMMQGFVANPDLSRLFADYWRIYIGQLPEAIFARVNENFYRTTFFELCSRYLSTWFTWNIERSYPQGRTDLEFVGKYHERFAGWRWVIEFKYYSNAEWERMKITISDLQPREEDTWQIRGYAQDLCREYPEAVIRLFIIYCIGNQGCKVFELCSEESDTSPRED